MFLLRSNSVVAAHLAYSKKLDILHVVEKIQKNCIIVCDISTVFQTLRMYYVISKSNTVNIIAGWHNVVFSSVFEKRAFFQFCLIGLIEMFTTVADCSVSQG